MLTIKTPERCLLGVHDQNLLILTRYYRVLNCLFPTNLQEVFHIKNSTSLYSRQERTLNIRPIRTVTHMSRNLHPKNLNMMKSSSIKKSDTKEVARMSVSSLQNLASGWFGLISQCEMRTQLQVFYSLIIQLFWNDCNFAFLFQYTLLTLMSLFINAILLHIYTGINY